MTTMDSDSESQDSDEGRRFRFEATRKDSLARVNSRKRKSSPARTDARRRSRSAERSNRDRRNVERARHDYKKSSRSNSDAKWSSRDRDARHSKETSESTRGGSRYKDSNDSKNSSNSTSNHKEAKLSRESPSRSSRKDSRTRERDRRRSPERSTNRSFDDKQLDKHANKFTARNKRHSRERSRERSRQGSKPKTEVRRSRDDVSKTDSTRKGSRRDNEARSVKEVERNAEETNVNNSEADSNSRASSPSSRQECKDLNLSDFDIVSDIDENSPDGSCSRRRSEELRNSRGESSPPRDAEAEIKRRVSKQQYERLLKRQAVKNRRSLEELHKVNAKNGEHASGTSNNNRSAVSDFLLGTAVTTTTVANPSAILTDDSSARQKERSKCRSNIDKDTNELDSDNSQSNSSTYGPILPPKLANDSCLPREVKEKEVSQSEEKERTAHRVIGPTLPPHLRQSACGLEVDAEDTFGPALPPHLEQHKSVDRESREESIGSTDAAEKEDSLAVDRAESDEDDDTMGPLPSDHPALEDDVIQRRLELRARRLKAELAMCDNEDEKKREEWMIELPLPQSVNLGLGPRKFRIRPAPDMSDRSSWTDTPADKARKRMEQLENRNTACEPAIKEEPKKSSEAEKSRKRQKSLLEIHQKKLQKKKKKEEKEANKLGKKVERRPFDRDVDLQANRFDDARKKSVLLKARELDDRFSRGKI